MLIIYFALFISIDKCKSKSYLIYYSNLCCMFLRIQLNICESLKYRIHIDALAGMIKCNIREKMQAYQLVDDLSSTTLCQAATKASLFFVKLIDIFFVQFIRKINRNNKSERVATGELMSQLHLHVLPF